LIRASGPSRRFTFIFTILDYGFRHDPPLALSDVAAFGCYNAEVSVGMVE
ncbi:MAG: hypothetical protein QOE37_2355, partial [Microbacteriaceae bacterium]|nr:hypothetical protein [Microbacteriaceae bacterium]